MRELTSHKLSTLNSSVDVFVVDAPREGGACHVYRIEPHPEGHSPGHIIPTNIHFQDGPIVENGVNGISDESLLAILEDRLAGFQSGEFACHQNAFALKHVSIAMRYLHERTSDRVERGVEGKSEK